MEEFSVNYSVDKEELKKEYWKLFWPSIRENKPNLGNFLIMLVIVSLFVGNYVLLVWRLINPSQYLIDAWSLLGFYSTVAIVSFYYLRRSFSLSMKGSELLKDEKLIYKDQTVVIENITRGSRFVLDKLNIKKVFKTDIYVTILDNNNLAYKIPVKSLNNKQIELLLNLNKGKITDPIGAFLSAISLILIVSFTVLMPLIIFLLSISIDILKMIIIK